MQEIHSIGGGRFFDGGGGGGGGGDRRVRSHQHHHQNNQQALKCPRCDSLNTKFCYYNNYNLSQPRHFCKSCRRYWTKGGVLRNVPVGGGCRKSKRSKPKSERPLTPTPPPATAAPPENRKSSSHSSSESSSLAAAAASEALSAPSSSNHEILTKQTTNPNLDSGLMEQGGDCGIFSEIGSFTSLITTTSEALSFGFGNIPETTSFRMGGSELLSGGEWQQGQQKETVMSGVISEPEMMTGSLMDPTVGVDLSVMQGKNENGGFGSLDWQGGTEQGLFDLPNTVDHSYWSHTHWTDQENPTLFHLP